MSTVSSHRNAHRACTPAGRNGGNTMSEKGKPHINEPDKAQAEAKELAPLQSPPPRGAETNAPEAGPADKKPVRNKFADKKKRHVPKVIKIGVPLLLVAAVIYGSVVLIRNLTKKEDENQIQTGIVSRGPLSQSVTGYGTIKPQLEAKYGDKTRGEVTEVAVNSGDTVHAGDLLFTVDPSELKKDLDEAYDDLNAARSRLEEAQDALNNLSVTAPFSGKLIDAPTPSQEQKPPQPTVPGAGGRRGHQAGQAGGRQLYDAGRLLQLCLHRQRGPRHGGQRIRARQHDRGAGHRHLRGPHQKGEGRGRAVPRQHHH